ncbi:MAG TPA: ABC transporter ATP-binding protein, partial [Gammaproteobacteria bacterium]
KKLREQMQIELKHLHEKLGVTTVYVTHDQREALTMSDRIAVINDGKLVQIDTPHNIYNHPANAFVADFIGESTILPLTRDNSGRLYFEDHLIESDLQTAVGSEWSLVIRPERLTVLKSGEAVDSEQTMVFPGEVRDFVFQGETAFALLSVGGRHLLSFRFATDSQSQYNLQPGEQISLGLKRHDLIVIPRGDGQ